MSFSEEEEDALVEVCVRRTREGFPFTILAFIKVASIFAGKDENGPQLTRSFVRGFIKRYSDTLRKKKGKVTSPKRSYETMLQKTEDFIVDINSKMAGNNVIGDEVSVPVVIGERRKSGGGTINVSYTRELALSCYIPFSMSDGSTPYHVYIFKSKDLKENEGILFALAPPCEKELRNVPHMVFLESEKGYLTAAHFEYIMDDFAKWWNTTRPGLECFLISDNLRIHKNEGIVNEARTKGINMINIMPGSSHWFQVHDQQPFGGLKKKMSMKKFDFLASFPIPHEERRDLLMYLFYQAEAEAFEPHIIQKTFAGVGLWPWNPDKILEMCREHSPVLSLPPQESLVHTILSIINNIEQKKRAEINEMCSQLKPVKVVSLKELEFLKSQKEARARAALDGGQTRGTRRMRSSTSVSVQPPEKCPRVMKRNRIPCSVKGCRKSHFWSKKWGFCNKCSKSFCPSHKNRLLKHRCKF